MNVKDLNKLNWDRLKTFFSVAQCGNYNDAAKELNMSQPNISRHIALLEEELGAELINRKKGPRGEILTEYGKVFLEITSNIYKLLREGVDKIEDSENIAGKITIATTKGFGIAWLLPKLLDFKKQYPDVIVDLTLADAFQSLVEKDADLYIGAKFLESPNLIHDYLGEFTVGAYASEEYLNKYGTPKRPEELNNHKIISWKLHSLLPYVNWLATAGLQKGTEREASLIFDDVNCVIEAAENGFGITTLMEYVGDSNQKLKRIFNEFNIGSYKMYFIIDRKKENLKRLNLLINHIRKYIN